MFEDGLYVGEEDEIDEDELNFRALMAMEF